MSLSDRMIEWMEACEVYRSAEKEARREEIYDFDYYFYYEKERMEKAEAAYLKCLAEELRKELDEES